jgi:hypothetical protein
MMSTFHAANRAAHSLVRCFSRSLAGLTQSRADQVRLFWVKRLSGTKSHHEHAEYEPIAR